MGSLAEDLLVLAVMAENAGVQSARRMPYALRGAELIQLCIDGRITVTDGRIKVVSAKETGSPGLDAALASMAQTGQQPSADVWVREARDLMVHGYLRHLQDAGVLRRRRLSLPASAGMSPRYRAADPARAGQIRDRIDAAVRDPGSAPDDAWSLAALAHAAGLADYLYPGTENQEQRRRLDEIARECQSAGPVLEAIAGEQQAMRAAMGPVMRSALSWRNDTAELVALNSLNHTAGPDVSHHPPGVHGHGGGHHG
ncbi:MAG TPA: GPP34 family phosphoprotein [Streptosporangiaceae bacterium]|nr:GPP34 family phosphoprotein [Streptosporangiaceae bacterium]